MNQHYYTNNKELDHNRKKWDFQLKNNTLSFISDSGVFSKNTVDFGSRLLIENFATNSTDGKILDVGCGYGPIGLALAKTYPAMKVDMVDVNKRAIELAKENATLNHIDNATIFESSVYENVTADDYRYILSNPPIRAGKVIVHQILSDAYDHLISGGELWIVIQKKQGGPSAQKKMEAVFGNVEMVARDKGYFIYKSVKQ